MHLSGARIYILAKTKQKQKTKRENKEKKERKKRGKNQKTIFFYFL